MWHLKNYNHIYVSTLFRLRTSFWRLNWTNNTSIYINLKTQTYITCYIFSLELHRLANQTLQNCDWKHKLRRGKRGFVSFLGKNDVCFYFLFFCLLFSYHSRFLLFTSLHKKKLFNGWSFFHVTFFSHQSDLFSFGYIKCYFILMHLWTKQKWHKNVFCDETRSRHIPI